MWKKHRLAQLSCRNNGPFLDHKKGLNFSASTPPENNRLGRSPNLWSRQWHFPRLILFLDIYFITFPGCTIPANEQQTPLKINRFSRWNSLIFGMFPYFQEAFAGSSREENPILEMFFPTIFLALLFHKAGKGSKQHFRPRYQASEEFVQESLGPGEILRGCWPYEGLIKGNQWIRSPDHKALVLGGYVRGRVGWLAIMDVTFWTNHFRLDAVQCQRLFQHTFGTHP